MTLTTEQVSTLAEEIARGVGTSRWRDAHAAAMLRRIAAMPEQDLQYQIEQGFRDATGALTVRGVAAFLHEEGLNMELSVVPLKEQS